jgi:hypothetical protein
LASPGISVDGGALSGVKIEKFSIIILETVNFSNFWRPIMQHEKNALNWFVQMVKTVAMNPLALDMSKIPDDILSQLYWDLWLKGGSKNE